MFAETISITGLFCRYKCSSGRSISEAASRFRNLCVYEPSALRKKPLEETFRFLEEAFQFVEEAF